MTLETISLFDSMEMDNTQRRVASRRALALAHNRVETSLGRFLRGARSEEEFFDRLALVQDDFSGLVTTASSEVGHDYPAAIASALRDHYLLAAKGVQFAETPTEKQEEEEEEKTAMVKEAPGKHHMPGVSDKRNRQYEHIKDSLLESGKSEDRAKEEAARTVNKQRAEHGETKEGRWSSINVISIFPQDPGMSQPAPQGAPQAQEDPNYQSWLQRQQQQRAQQAQGLSPAQFQHPDPMMDNEPGTLTFPQEWNRAGKQGSPLGSPADRDRAVSDWLNQQTPQWREQAGATPIGGGQCPECKSPLNPNGDCERCGWYPGASQRTGLPWIDKYPNAGAEFERDSQPGYMAAANPSEQRDTSPDTVTCPECGGDGKTAGAAKCAKCSGKGKVPNFGDSAVDFYGADIKTSAEDGAHGNTDLGGPSPKMKKEKWTPQSVPKPNSTMTGEEGIGQTHSEEKDIVEPIKATNPSPLKEIDGSEATQDKNERETLPENSGDAGFDGGGPGPAPHTDTFGNDGQTTPVTNKALASWPSSTAVTSAFLDI